MKTKCLVVCMCLAISCTIFAQQLEKISDLSLLRDGDLLFEVSPVSNAITNVTHGFDGMKIDHVAIYWHQGVFEATKRNGVNYCDLSSFLERNTTERGEIMVLVGRVLSKYNLRKTIKTVKTFIGLPYDSLFLPDNRAIYCSELVQKSYVNRKNEPIFSPIPMSFHDKSGNITEYWKSFYRQFNMNVPEGEPGTNPGELSRRENIKILYRLF